MSVRFNGMARLPITRRSLAKRMVGVLFGAFTARGAAARILSGDPAKPIDAVPSGIPGQPTPVVSFFLDQPYLDMSGLGKPYQPPRGLRAGQPLAALTEQEFRGIMPHI